MIRERFDRDNLHLTAALDAPGAERIVEAVVQIGQTFSGLTTMQNDMLAKIEAQSAMIAAQGAMIARLEAGMQALLAGVETAPLAKKPGKGKKRPAMSQAEPPVTPAKRSHGATLSPSPSSAAAAAAASASAASAAAACAAAAAASAASSTPNSAAHTPPSSAFGSLMPDTGATSPFMKLGGCEAAVSFLKYVADNKKMPHLKDGDAGRCRECFKWYQAMASKEEMQVP